MSRRRRFWQRIVATCAATPLLVAILFVAAAYAESPVPTSSQDAAQLVAQIEQATQAYQDATNTVEDLASQIAQSESHATEIEQALPAQRDLAAKSIKQLYLFQQSSPGILDMLLSANDFNEFLTALEYLDAIHDHNTTQVTTLQGMHDDLVQTRATLTMELDAAKQKQSEALKALDTIRVSLNSLQQSAAQQSNNDTAQQDTSSALQDAQKIVATLPEPVAQAVSAPAIEPSQQQEDKPQSNKEEEQGQTNPEPEPQQAVEQKPEEQKPEEQPAPVEPETPTAETPSAPQEQAQDPNVASWAARIDAYLSSYGAPLAGHGATFAQAAADYGVDPRLSPAIAIIESGGGKVCFLPHNCWGWGSASWPDWDSAIRGHISGFASIYGSTLSPEGAKAYASMDEWEMWYSLLQSEMASI